MPMPCIRGNHNGRAARIPVAIVDAARYKRHKEAAAPVLAGVKPYVALIDTGATSTMISGKVVSELSLQPVTAIPYMSLDGLVYRKACLFHVALYESLTVENLQRYGSEPYKIHICRKEIIGGILNDGTSFDVLLGMDIISTWELHFYSDGHFELTF